MMMAKAKAQQQREEGSQNHAGVFPGAFPAVNISQLSLEDRVEGEDEYVNKPEGDTAEAMTGLGDSESKCSAQRDRTSSERLAQKIGQIPELSHQTSDQPLHMKGPDTRRIGQRPELAHHTSDELLQMKVPDGKVLEDDTDNRR